MNIIYKCTKSYTVCKETIIAQGHRFLGGWGLICLAQGPHLSLKNIQSLLDPTHNVPRGEEYLELYTKVFFGLSVSMGVSWFILWAITHSICVYMYMSVDKIYSRVHLHCQSSDRTGHCLRWTGWSPSSHSGNLSADKDKHNILAQALEKTVYCYL